MKAIKVSRIHALLVVGMILCVPGVPAFGSLLVLNSDSLRRTSSGTLTSSTAQSTLSYDAGGTADLLVVSVSSEKSGQPYSVSYAGDPLSLAVSGSAGRSADIWYLLNPSTAGAQNLVVDFTTVGVVNGFGLGVASVDNTDPVRTTIQLHNTAQNNGGNNVSIETFLPESFIMAAYTSNDAGGSTVNMSNATLQLFGQSGTSAVGSAEGASGYRSASSAGTYNFAFSGSVGASPTPVAAAFVAIVPEPSTAILLYLSMTAFAFLRRCRRRLSS